MLESLKKFRHYFPERVKLPHDILNPYNVFNFFNNFNIFNLYNLPTVHLIVVL
jgi:hypothetical protein